MKNEYLLEIRNVRKEFPGVKALDGVSLFLKRGEIHALLGENGAGKSTLMKIIAGIYTLDEGEILFDGKPFVARKPVEALEKGIAMVHQ
ncbi:MAG: ATP-binding cassette domain-containing protein, partial [Eisenbergiella sp.]